MTLALDKYLGIVSPSQPLQLRRLKTRHKQVIIMHLSGMDHKTIADETGFDPSYISSILRSDLAQEAISDYLKFMDQEFSVLYQLAIAAVRDGLKDTQDIDTRLKAADKFFKAHGKYNAGGNAGKETAEDVVRRIMELRIVEERPVSGAISSDSVKDSVQNVNKELPERTKSVGED